MCQRNIIFNRDFFHVLNPKIFSSFESLSLFPLDGSTDSHKMILPQKTKSSCHYSFANLQSAEIRTLYFAISNDSGSVGGQVRGCFSNPEMGKVVKRGRRRRGTTIPPCVFNQKDLMFACVLYDCIHPCFPQILGTYCIL